MNISISPEIQKCLNYLRGPNWEFVPNFPAFFSDVSPNHPEPLDPLEVRSQRYYMEVITISLTDRRTELQTKLGIELLCN